MSKRQINFCCLIAASFFFSWMFANGMMHPSSDMGERLYFGAILTLPVSLAAWLLYLFWTKLLK